MTFEGWEGEGGWKILKKYIVQPPKQRKKKKKQSSCMASSEEKRIICMVQPKKILTNHRQPIPTCSPANLSHLCTRYALLFIIS